jgi:7,8-dihydroneopterin aldolase/epimerase/oxygenase
MNELPPDTTRAPVTDRIFLSALTVECIVGIWEWERRVKQTVIVDLELAADIRKAAATDRIEDTIDYKKVAKRLLAFIGESQFHLVETLTERIAQLVVTEFGVSWVKVRLNKQGAIRGARDVGIEIERSARDYPGLKPGA